MLWALALADHWRKFLLVFLCISRTHHDGRENRKYFWKFAEFVSLDKINQLDPAIIIGNHHGGPLIRTA